MVETHLGPLSHKLQAERSIRRHLLPFLVCLHIESEVVTGDVEVVTSIGGIGF